MSLTAARDIWTNGSLYSQQQMNDLVLHQVHVPENTVFAILEVHWGVSEAAEA